jgi:hypothetical protein
MDPVIRLTMFVAAAIAATAVVKTIADAAVRFAQVSRSPTVVDDTAIRERLERIEIAVDAIAIEVERLGEHQRFNAQLALNRPEPLPPKVVTPH